MTYGEPRYSTVPWLVTALDLEEGRGFAWEIEFRRDEDKATCLRVAHPFQSVPEAFLVIHAIRGDGRDGGRITLAISETPRYDVFAKESFRLNHPRRSDDGDHRTDYGD